MNKYFTTLDISENGYIGTVYNAQTNELVYQTKPHPSQAQASYDISSFLATNKPSENTTSPVAPNALVNTTVYQPTPGTSTPKRCCGR